MEISINVNAPAGAKIEKKTTPLEYFLYILLAVCVIWIVVACTYWYIKTKKRNAAAAHY